jgi:arsenate reductase (thioredoxin)
MNARDSAPVKTPTNILFLCTGNSARSILGEAIASRAARLRGFSAGSQPKGAVHPQSLRILEARGHDISLLASKSWDVFAAPGAPQMDIVITVCDSAAAGTCPIWPGAPVFAHWGLPDPAAAPPELQPQAFAHTYAELERRIEALAALPLEALEPRAVKNALAAIPA